MIDQITVRYLEYKDIPSVIEYYYETPLSYWKTLHMNREKFPTKSQYVEILNKQVKEETQNKRTLIVCHNHVPVGILLINHVVPNESGILHAHLFHEKYRNRGIMTIAYPVACVTFCENANLKKIIFETPVDNIGPNRIKEKLGIKPLKKIKLTRLMAIEGTIANYYEIKKEEAKKILRR